MCAELKAGVESLWVTECFRADRLTSLDFLRVPLALKLHEYVIYLYDYTDRQNVDIY